MDIFGITGKTIVDGNWHVFSGQVAIVVAMLKFIMTQKIKNTEVDGELKAVNRRVDGVVGVINKNGEHLSKISEDFGEMKLTVNTIQVHLENKDGFRDGQERKYKQV